MVKLTADNYFSQEALTAYFSVSQYKDFVGTLGMKGCEAMALAKLRGDWQEEMTVPLLVGSYVDAYFEGSLDSFKLKYPDIMTKETKNQDPRLRSEYKQANEIISRIESDSYFMRYMGGEKQVIFSGEIFGVPWKCKIDSLLRSICISDLKVMQDIRKAFWVKDHGYVSFIEYWGYDLAAAIYQKLCQIHTGEKLPFFLAAATKEKVTDIEIIGFKQSDLDDALSTIEPNVQRIRDLKTGHAFPDRCELCDYCKSTKVLTKPIHFSELLLKV